MDRTQALEEDGLEVMRVCEQFNLLFLRARDNQELCQY